MSKKMISLEVSSELREALRVEAFNRNTSISALIRDILETSLKDKIKSSKEIK